MSLHIARIGFEEPRTGFFQKLHTHTNTHTNNRWFQKCQLFFDVTSSAFFKGHLSLLAAQSTQIDGHLGGGRRGQGGRREGGRGRRGSGCRIAQRETRRAAATRRRRSGRPVVVVAHTATATATHTSASADEVNAATCATSGTKVAEGTDVRSVVVVVVCRSACGVAAAAVAGGGGGRAVVDRVVCVDAALGANHLICKYKLVSVVRLHCLRRLVALWLLCDKRRIDCAPNGPSRSRSRISSSDSTAQCSPGLCAASCSRGAPSAFCVYPLAMNEM